MAGHTLADAVRDTTINALDRIAIADERIIDGTRHMVMQKIIPKKDGHRAALLLVGDVAEIRAIYDFLNDDEGINNANS